MQLDHTSHPPSMIHTIFCKLQYTQIPWFLLFLVCSSLYLMHPSCILLSDLDNTCITSIHMAQFSISKLHIRTHESHFSYQDPWKSCFFNPCHCTLVYVLKKECLGVYSRSQFSYNSMVWATTWVSFFLNMLLPSMYTLLETSLVMFSLMSCSIHSCSQGGDVVGSLISNWQWTQTGYFMLFNKWRSFGSIAWHTNSTQLAEDSEIQFPQQKHSQCMNCEGRLHTLQFVKQSIVAFWISCFICSPFQLLLHIRFKPCSFSPKCQLLPYIWHVKQVSWAHIWCFWFCRYLYLMNFPILYIKCLGFACVIILCNVVVWTLDPGFSPFSRV